MAPLLRYFIVRPSTEVMLPSGESQRQPDTIVPLIPMDMIPEGIDIMGIPRQLTLSETIGMQNVGIDNLDEDQNPITTNEQPEHGENSTTHRPVKTPESTVAFEQMASAIKTMSISSVAEEAHDSKTGVSPTSTLGSSQGQGVSLTASPSRPYSTVNQRTGSPVEYIHRRRSSSRSTSRDPEEPLHCQPWCHHGKCPRGDSCRSKHEMPATLEGLKKVGLEKLPYWYSSGKSRRQWLHQGPKGWAPRRHIGRGPIDAFPHPAYWGSRLPPRQLSHEDRVKAENRRAWELMNPPARSDGDETKKDVRPESRARASAFSDHMDLISMDCSDAISHAVMEGTGA
ncbi:hypothetical protein LIA77_04501 [Sarocladium implicatum]|nr:hypothetical protein LIA77_04501 [Sarocladium implicatum]